MKQSYKEIKQKSIYSTVQVYVFKKFIPASEIKIRMRIWLTLPAQFSCVLHLSLNMECRKCGGKSRKAFLPSTLLVKVVRHAAQLFLHLAPSPPPHQPRPGLPPANHLSSWLTLKNSLLSFFLSLPTLWRPLSLFLLSVLVSSRLCDWVSCTLRGIKASVQVQFQSLGSYKTFGSSI